MGCFNSIGFYSKMPIHYNDNVVLFICAGYNYNSATYMPIYTVDRFFPITFQINGKYNDCGGIKNVEKDVNVEYLEKLFGYSIEDVVTALGDASFITYSDLISRKIEDPFRDSSYKMIAEIIEKLHNGHNKKDKIDLCDPFVRDNMFLTCCMERKEVFDVMVKCNKYTEYKQSYNAAVKLISEFNLKINIIKDAHEIMFCDEVLDIYRKVSNKEELTQSERDMYKTLQTINYADYEMSLTRRFVYNLLPYKQTDFIDPETWRDIIFNFIDFTRVLDFVGGYFCSNAYGSQSIDDAYDIFKELNNTYVTIINNMKRN